MTDEIKPEQRRAPRIRPGPFRVDMESGPGGTLIDISALGALLELPMRQDVDSQLPFDLQWGEVAVRLHGRVVRSTPRYEGPERVTWMEPTSYYVAVEFFDVGAQSATTLRELLRKSAEPDAE